MKMRIACLQFAPQVGDIDNNLNRADAVLSKANPDDLDLLVLPELAFTGTMYKSFLSQLQELFSGEITLWLKSLPWKYSLLSFVRCHNT